MSRAEEDGGGRLPCGCPPAWPEWDGRDVDLGGMLVQQTSFPCLLHMPVGYEARLFHQHETLRRLELHERWPGFVLSRTGLFRGQILCPLIEERSPLHGVYNLPAPFHLRCRVVKGDVGRIKPEVQAMQSALIAEAKMPGALYLAYLTCPRCQERRGGMRIMVLRHWRRSRKLAGRLRRRRGGRETGASG
ncbi:MAG: hypothetical protein D6682_05460 [Zetaproteobacteria bacterium]|nr:MAG: hypothetical protein D6682_05460 [Zetaproteobacteria bacterium]